MPAPPLAPAVTKWHRERFARVLESVERMVCDWEIRLSRETVIDIERSPGFFFGISPASSLDQIGERREDNPASLIHFPKRAPSEQWLLVTMEAQGRKENPKEIDKPPLFG